MYKTETDMNIVEEKIELYEILRQIRERSNFPLCRLLTMAGMLDNYIYCALKSRGACWKEESGEIQHDVALVRAIAESEEIWVESPVTYIQKYLHEQWVGAASHQQSVELIREHLGNSVDSFCYKNGDLKPVFDIFKFKRQGNGATDKVCRPPVLYKFNLKRALLLYEVVMYEIKFEQSRKTELTEDCRIGGVEELRKYFPEHLGYNTIQVFNIVFEGVCEFGRCTVSKKRVEMAPVEVPEVPFFEFRSLGVITKVWRKIKAYKAAMEEFKDWCASDVAPAPV